MPKCSALFTSDTSVHHCHHFRAVVALDAKRPIVLSRPGIEPGRSSALNRRSFVLRLPRPDCHLLGDPGHEDALAWVYVMWSDEELGKAVFGKVVD